VPTTGGAAAQGPLWGARARDWAELQEQGALPLHGAALDASAALLDVARERLPEADVREGDPAVRTRRGRATPEGRSTRGGSMVESNPSAAVRRIAGVWYAG